MPIAAGGPILLSGVSVTPSAHAASHTDGSDDIQSATAAQKGVATAAQITKLDGIEALADVTGTNAPQAHAASHAAATGGDALSTGAAGAIAIGDAAAIGAAETFSRSDHKHSLAAPAAPADVTKAAAATGVAPAAARADHKHDVTTAVAGAVAIGDSAAEGAATSLARSDHQHSLAAPAAPANVTKAAAATGSAAEPARADHKHDVTTAAPAAIGTANAEGAATSLARSDHVHDHGAQTTGTHHAAAVAAGASGFLTGADKTKLDGVAAGADVTGDNPPQAHAASHTDGSDDIQDATASQKGVATAAQITKLDDLNSQAINTVSTTDATVTAIATIPITDDSVNLIEARCVARRTDVDEAAGFIRRAVIFRRAAGSAAFLGSQDPTLEREDDNQWDFNIVVSGNNALLQVTGRSARNIDWKSFHEIRTIT